MALLEWVNGLLLLLLLLLAYMVVAYMVALLPPGVLLLVASQTAPFLWLLAAGAGMLSHLHLVLPLE